MSGLKVYVLVSFSPRAEVLGLYLDPSSALAEVRRSIVASLGTGRGIDRYIEACLEELRLKGRSSAGYLLTEATVSP